MKRPISKRAAPNVEITSRQISEEEFIDSPFNAMTDKQLNLILAGIPSQPWNTSKESDLILLRNLFRKMSRSEVSNFWNEARSKNPKKYKDLYEAVTRNSKMKTIWTHIYLALNKEGIYDPKNKPQEKPQEGAKREVARPSLSKEDINKCVEQKMRGVPAVFNRVKVGLDKGGLYFILPQGNKRVQNFALPVGLVKDPAALKELQSNKKLIITDSRISGVKAEYWKVYENVMRKYWARICEKQLTGNARRESGRARTPGGTGAAGAPGKDGKDGKDGSPGTSAVSAPAGAPAAAPAAPGAPGAPAATSAGPQSETKGGEGEGRLSRVYEQLKKDVSPRILDAYINKKSGRPMISYGDFYKEYFHPTFIELAKKTIDEEVLLNKITIIMRGEKASGDKDSTSPAGSSKVIRYVNDEIKNKDLWQEKLESMLAKERFMADDSKHAYTRVDKEFYKIAADTLQGLKFEMYPARETLQGWAGLVRVDDPRTSQSVAREDFTDRASLEAALEKMVEEVRTYLKEGKGKLVEKGVQGFINFYSKTIINWTKENYGSYGYSVTLIAAKNEKDLWMGIYKRGEESPISKEVISEDNIANRSEETYKYIIKLITYKISEDLKK